MDCRAHFHKPFLIVRRYPKEKVMDGYAVIQELSAADGGTGTSTVAANSSKWIVPEE
jgi:hypothetical protein